MSSSLDSARPLSSLTSPERLLCQALCSTRDTAERETKTLGPGSCSRREQFSLFSSPTGWSRCFCISGGQAPAWSVHVHTPGGDPRPQVSQLQSQPLGLAARPACDGDRRSSQHKGFDVIEMVGRQDQAAASGQAQALCSGRQQSVTPRLPPSTS